MDVTKLNKSYQEILVTSEVEISDLKQNDIFVELYIRVCSNKGNINHQAVTEAFIDEIVDNPEIYNGIPLYCDLDKLLAGSYGRLTHLHDEETGQYGTKQIGSLWKFSKEKSGDYCALCAVARICKRDVEICEPIIEMYERGILFVSVEIKYRPAYTQILDGIEFIDAADQNFLFGVTVVSRPAFKDCGVLTLVAEEQGDDNVADNEVNETMDKLENEQVVNSEPEITEPVAENPVQEPNVANAEAQEPAAPSAEENTEAQVATASENPETSVDAGEPQTAEAEEHSAENSPEANPDQGDNGTMDANAEIEFPCCPESSAQDAEIDAAHAAIEAEAAQLRATIAQYEAELEVLRAEHSELEAIRAAQHAEELKARQNQALAFAEQSGLNVEDDAVKTAIAEVSYERLALMVMEQKPQVANAEAKDAINLGNINASIGLPEVYDDAWLFARAEKEAK